jgi:hypothetical protein
MGLNMDLNYRRKMISESYKQKLKSSDLQTFNQYLESKEHLEWYCSMMEWDSNHCKEQKDKLNKIAARENEKGWQECCEKAWGWNGKVKKSEIMCACKFGSKEHLSRSEKLALEKGIIPPGWTHIFDCGHCGIVVVREITTESFGGGTECPWCDYLRDKREIEKGAAPYQSPLPNHYFDRT